MILALAFAAGFGFGAMRARNRGGTPADMVQYGVAHGVAAGVLMVAGALVFGLVGGSPR